MNASPPPLKIGTPCPKQWSEMHGNAKRRFCEQCQLHVHNLSEMSDRERTEFVIETKGSACIAYELRSDGTMITPTMWRKFSKPLNRFKLLLMGLLSFLFPFLFSSCQSRPTAIAAGTPAPQPSPNEQPMLLGEAPNTPDASRVPALGKVKVQKR